jgi:hypothetical protein
MEIEYGFIHITDDEISRAITEEAKYTAIILMKDDLKNYINKMGNESTFKGWIAHICPENINIDKRLERPHSEWHAIWNKEIEIYNKSRENIINTPE